MPKSVNIQAVQKVTIGPITTTGVDGSATGSAVSARIAGLLLAAHIDYSAGQAATADVTIATTTAPTVTLLTRSNSATDGWFFPRQQVQDSAGANIAGVYEAVPFDDTITVSVAQADNNETVTATLLIAPLMF